MKADRFVVCGMAAGAVTGLMLVLLGGMQYRVWLDELNESGQIKFQPTLRNLIVRHPMLARFKARTDETKQFAEWAKVLKPPSGLRPIRVMDQLEANYAWNLRSLDGKKISLADLKGRTIFLNFWATWCGPCKMEMPSIQRLYDRMKAEGIAFVAVSDESPADVRSFVRKMGFTFPIYTTGEEPPGVYRHFGIPTIMVISPGGNVVFKHVGCARWDDGAVIKFLRTVSRSGKSGGRG
jgi:thiol-disulfide isomerase/thioredoxin